MKAIILRLRTGEFPNEKTGEIIEYGKIMLATHLKEDTKNDIGYEVEVLSIKPEYIDALKSLILKTVDVEYDFVRQNDGNYKKKIISINGKEV